MPGGVIIDEFPAARSIVVWIDVGESARGAARWAAPLLYPSIFAAIVCDNRVFRSDIPDFGLTASTISGSSLSAAVRVDCRVTCANFRQEKPNFHWR